MFVCAVRPILCPAEDLCARLGRQRERALTSLDARGAAACSAADKLRAVAGDALALPKEQRGPAKTDLCRSLCLYFASVAMCLLRYSANSQIPSGRRKHDGSRPSTRATGRMSQSGKTGFTAKFVDVAVPVLIFATLRLDVTKSMSRSPDLKVSSGERKYSEIIEKTCSLKQIRQMGVRPDLAPNGTKWSADSGLRWPSVQNSELLGRHHVCGLGFIGLAVYWLIPETPLRARRRRAPARPSDGGPRRAKIG